MRTKQRKFSRFRCPILAYHNVVAQDKADDKQIRNSPFTVTVDQFIRQMQFLADNDFRTIDLDRFIEIVADSDSTARFPESYVLITFDDGWHDNYQYAFPVLRELQLTATFFVITGRMGTKQYMSWQQLREIQDAGMHIESHTHSHVPLELLADDDVDDELNRARQSIAQHLGKQVRYLSFPHGSYNKKILKQAEHAGYQACGTSNTDYARSDSRLMELPRLLIRRSFDDGQFQRICRAETAVMLQQKLIQKSKSLVKDTMGLQNYMVLHRLVYGTRRQETTIRKGF